MRWESLGAHECPSDLHFKNVSAGVGRNQNLRPGRLLQLPNEGERRGREELRNGRTPVIAISARQSPQDELMDMLSSVLETGLLASRLGQLLVVGDHSVHCSSPHEEFHPQHHPCCYKSQEGPHREWCCPLKSLAWQVYQSGRGNT